MMDLEDLESCEREHESYLGSKGTTGTQASFLETLFDGDQETIEKIDPNDRQEDGI